MNDNSTLDCSDAYPEPIEKEPARLVLFEQAQLCCNSEMPKNYIELNDILWKAFDLGKQYRDKGGKDY